MSKLRTTLLSFFLVAALVSPVTAKTGPVHGESAFPVVRKVYSERRRDRALEDAILATLPGYEEQLFWARLRGPDARDYAVVDYFYNRVDLNGDGRRETLVWLHGAWVGGTGGHVAQVYERRGRAYRLVAQIEPTWNPIVVSTKRRNGWRTLVTRVGGGGVQPGYWAELRFDGVQYADGFAGVRVRAEAIRGVAYIADDRRTGFLGIPLEPRRRKASR